MNSFGNKNPFSPKPAETTPIIIKIASFTFCKIFTSLCFDYWSYEYIQKMIFVLRTYMYDKIFSQQHIDIEKKLY